MHFCTAYVAIEADKDQVVFRDAFRPISWPEIEILRHVHGDEAVWEVAPFVWVGQTPRDEAERLKLIYGEGPVSTVFPGRSPKFEMDAPEATIKARQWRNPLNGAYEMIEPPPADAKPVKGKREHAFEA